MDVRVHIGCELERCDTSCFLTYQPTCESTGPECCPERKPCPPKCPPLRARDAIRLKSHEMERWFSLKEHCADPSFNAIQNCMSLRISRIGNCETEWSIIPTAADIKGRVRFTWPGQFLGSPPGYYQATLVVNGCEVKHMLLYKPFAIVNVHATEGVAESPCNKSCGCVGTDGCDCGFPQVEQPNYLHKPDCGDSCNDTCA